MQEEGATPRGGGGAVEGFRVEWIVSQRVRERSSCWKAVNRHRGCSQSEDTAATNVKVPVGGGRRESPHCSLVAAMYKTTQAGAHALTRTATPCLKASVGVTREAEGEMGESGPLVKQGSILQKFAANLNLMGHSLSLCSGLWCRRVKTRTQF